MSDLYDQVPYGAITQYDPSIFAENPEPRCPCVLLLDTSGSMQGRPIAALNDGLTVFKDELMADSLATKRVEVAMITFGPVKIEAEFQGADVFQPPVLQAGGDTPMGGAILQALEMIRARKQAYRENGVEYYRPWIFLITDGGPTDRWEAVANEIRQGENDKQFQFFAVGVEGANFDVLRQIGVREPLRLSGLRFRDLFQWLSKSLGAVSHSQTGEQVPLSNPATPGGWATVG